MAPLQPQQSQPTPDTITSDPPETQPKKRGRPPKTASTQPAAKPTDKNESKNLHRQITPQKNRCQQK